MSDDLNSATPKSRWTLAVTLVAALLLAMSITMLTDFTRRLLSSDPDTLGVVSILFQAVLTVGASSTFLSEGWTLLPNFLAGFQKSEAGKARLRFMLSGLLLILVTSVWFFVPPYLAEYYNSRGYNLPATKPAAAARDYRRAIALDPTQPYAFFNLGEELEAAYQYSDAAEQYQIAITTNPSDYLSYNNLARVLILDGKPLTALQITDDALLLPGLSDSSKAALRKNRAEAEFALGYFQAAIDDAGTSHSAAGECIIARSYGKLNQADAAKDAWTKFTQLAQTQQTTLKYDPDCGLLAQQQETSHANP